MVTMHLDFHREASFCKNSKEYHVVDVVTLFSLNIHVPINFKITLSNRKIFILLFLYFENLKIISLCMFW